VDRLDAMRVFVAVVEGGSFSAGGRSLELETHLQARLLNRSTRKLELTDAGRVYIDACRRILDEVGEAERAAAGEYSAPRGELVVTAPVVFGRLHVLPVITEFLHAFPAVDVRLILGDRLVHLLDEHIDLAVRIGHLQDSSLKAMPVGSLRQSVCASPNYLSAHGVPRHPVDLGAHACITFDALGMPSRWVFRAAGESLAVAVHSRLVVNTAEAAVDAARADLGVTRLLSYQIDAACRAKELSVVLDAYEPPPIPVSLVFDGQRRIALKLRAFLDFAAPRLRERLPRIAASRHARKARAPSPGRRARTPNVPR
jgi:DNA-binding transcriptional LysR family regulator